MPSLAQVRNRADDWLSARWPTIQARQEAYFAAHNRYWQGLRSAVITPNHTTASFADAAPDALDAPLHDQAETWLDFLPEIDGLAIPAVFVFDVYEAPGGNWGYVATVYAAYNGTMYSRSQNVGPETWRTVGWHVVDETEPT